MNRRDFLATGAGLIALGGGLGYGLTTDSGDSNYMVEQTPNLGLNKPQTGEGIPKDPVTDLLNANWDTIDANIGGGSHDITVESTAALEAAFQGLLGGETIFIAQPSTPYRPNDWLDITANGVTVLGENQFAKNGERMIKAADGNGSGGFRIGPNGMVENVHISGVGFEGQKNMPGGPAQGHGFYFENARHSEIEGCHATKLHPYHVHANGGSGIAVDTGCEHIRVANNWIHDTGDRGIQTAGRFITIVGNHCSYGYDRAIALQMKSTPTGPVNSSENVIVANNICHNNSDGSIVGFALSDDGGGGNYIITNNIMAGDHRSGVQMFTQKANETYENIVVANNQITAPPSADVQPAIQVGRNNAGSFNNVTIANNSIENHEGSGIGVQANAYDVTITGNTMERVALDGSIWPAGPAAGILLEGTEGATVANNTIADAGDDAVRIKGGIGCIISANQTRNSKGAGIRTNGDYNIYLGNITEKGFAGTMGTNSKRSVNIQH